MNHSLIHWLALSGVAVDVGNEPASYQNQLSAGAAFLAENPPVTTEKNTASSSASLAESQKNVQKPAGKAPSVSITIDRFNSYDALLAFYKEWKGIGLAKMAARAVLPAGCTHKPKLMVISDIPDDMEDRHGETFGSPANTVIRNAIKAAGIPSDSVLFSYLSKWRTPAKRPLTPPEKDICAQLLTQEIALVDPDVILALGESTIRVLGPDLSSGALKFPLNFSYQNHNVNKLFTVYASQKGEFLLKNTATKKSFWFSLLDLATKIRTEEP